MLTDKAMTPQKRLVVVSLLVAVVVTSGMCGYRLLNPDWTLLDSLYMTVITLTTVGFSEVHPLDDASRIFTILLLSVGIGTFAYGLSTLVASLVEGQLRFLLWQRRMEKKVKKVRDHFIICGLGETGSIVMEEFQTTNTSFVVVEKSPERIQKLVEAGILVVAGSATEDKVLIEAGVERARGLVAALPSDEENVFTILTAREINPNLKIVSVSSSDEAEPKVRRAGADYVVTPSKIGGMRMASVMIRPTVVSFLDIMMKGQDMSLRMEESEIPANSSLCGKTLAEAAIPAKTGLMCVAIRKSKDKRYLYNPKSQTAIEPHDVLIVLGSTEQLEELRKYVVS
ncbi:MAG TPA: potassium channel protein [bacterium]|nr:potassium channel protein [bacterium]